MTLHGIHKTSCSLAESPELRNAYHRDCKHQEMLTTEYNGYTAGIAKRVAVLLLLLSALGVGLFFIGLKSFNQFQ